MIRTFIKFLGGATLGVAVGAAIGVALAPKSGSDLQDNLRRFWDDVVAAGQQAQAERREELLGQFSQAKQVKKA